MDRSVIERLVIHHGLAHDWEVEHISDHDLALLASFVHNQAEKGAIKTDGTKLIVTLLVITVVLWKLQPIINKVLSSLVQNSGLLGLCLIVLVPVFLLFVIVPTFHR